LNCPECGKKMSAYKTQCKVFTIKGVKLEIVRRRYKCTQCGYRLASAEMLESDSIKWSPMFGERMAFFEDLHKLPNTNNY